MKKLFLAMLAMGTLATANAQEPKSILLYGQADMSSMRANTLYKYTNWDANIGIGYQFNHNWTIGLHVNWGQKAVKDSAGINNTDNMYAVGPFARYSHYIRKSETFFWFAQMDFDYIGSYHTNDGNPATNKASGVNAGIWPGLGINVGRGLCLNFAIGGLSYMTLKDQANAYSDNGFMFNFGKQANFGISKNFNTGHKMHSHHEPGDEVHRRRADHMEDEDDAAPKPKRRERNRDEDE